MTMANPKSMSSKILAVGLAEVARICSNVRPTSFNEDSSIRDDRRSMPVPIQRNGPCRYLPSEIHMQYKSLHCAVHSYSDTSLREPQILDVIRCCLRESCRTGTSLFLSSRGIFLLCSYHCAMHIGCCQAWWGDLLTGWTLPSSTQM